MSLSPQNPAFFAYAIASLLLCINLIFLWVYSGITRARSGTVMNPEDAKKAKLSETDPAAVARVLRVHRNAEATTYPFLVLGLIFVLAGGAAATAQILFGAFAAARLLYSFVYLRGKQPWRSIFFAFGALATISLLVCDVLLLIHHPAA